MLTKKTYSRAKKRPKYGEKFILSLRIIILGLKIYILRLAIIIFRLKINFSPCLYDFSGRENNFFQGTGR